MQPARRREQIAGRGRTYVRTAATVAMNRSLLIVAGTGGTPQALPRDRFQAVDWAQMTRQRRFGGISAGKGPSSRDNLAEAIAPRDATQASEATSFSTFMCGPDGRHAVC